MTSSSFSTVLEQDSSAIQRKQRLFAAGQMKLLVLSLIQTSPRYGYDIIREIGQLVGYGYTPSTGSIYPALTYLEKQQFIEVNRTQDGRKKYQILPAGQAHLESHAKTLHALYMRFSTRRKIETDAHYSAIHEAMEALKSALQLKLQHASLSSEVIQQIASTIHAAASEITAPHDQHHA